MKLSHAATEMAATVIAASGRDRPADRVLQNELRNVSRAESDLRREITKTVFAWFKWYRWLDRQNPDPSSLRRVVELQREYQSHPDSFDPEQLRRRSIPEWCHRHVEVTDAWIRSLQQEGRLWLRTRPGTRAAVMEQLGAEAEALPGPLEDALDYRGDRDLFRTQAFHQGRFEIQDLSSQVVGWICDPHAGESWWDACAGEGGKTLHLGDLMKNRGLIWATDRASWRLQKLKRRAARARLYNYRAVSWSQTNVLPTKNRFDGVLVDAPCSGLGTWQRNPHARWTTREEDVRELAAIQIRLLALCAKALKPGGKLVYSVCTLTKDETDDVADAVSAEVEGLEPWTFLNPLEAGRPPVSRLWLWPQQKSGNGMFIAAWRRRD